MTFSLILIEFSNLTSPNILSYEQKRNRTKKKHNEEKLCQPYEKVATEFLFLIDQKMKIKRKIIFIIT